MENSINLNAKDNGGKVNIGTWDANQSAILGNNFLGWFDEFMDILLQGGFIGNLMTPVIPSPTLIQSISKYKSMKDPKFLSKNVFLNDNGYVNTVTRNPTPISQTGDKWTSTVDENTITIVEQTNSKSNITSPDSTPSGSPFITCL